MLRRRPKRGRQKFDEQDEFITPDQVHTVNVDAKAMFGIMPNESECILMDNVSKLNHECQWIHRCLALTNEFLCFSFDKYDAIRDKILLSEVREPYLFYFFVFVDCVLNTDYFGRVKESGSRNRKIWQRSPSPSGHLVIHQR